VLPIVDRELRVAARSAKIYRRRLWLGMSQAAVACAALFISGGGSRASGAQWFFSTFSNLALLLCLTEGIRKTSEAISAEKREGTLGFLFLSTLSGADVVVGKLTGALIRSLSVLLPFVPILALGLLLGGTTVGEFWRVVLLLVTTLLLSLSLCLFVSTVSRERSIIAAIITLVLLCLVPLAAHFFQGGAQLLRLASPFEILAAAEDLAFRREAHAYWLGLAFHAMATILALAASSFLAPRVWQEQSFSHERAVERSARKRPLLEQNPVLWLSYDARGQRWFHLIAILLFLAGALPLILLWVQIGISEVLSIFPAGAAAALFVIIWLRVAIRTAISMFEARNDGSFELILSTPLTLEEVIRGYWLALWEMVRIPVVCAFGLLLLAFVTTSGNSVSRASWTGKIAVELLLQIVVFGALGMWMGLKCKTRAKAAVYTILLGFLPWIVCPFTVLVQIVLLLRALDQVKALLRRTRNGGADLRIPVWYPRPVPHPNIPPVIR
jgi:ABC-type transport system involved in multi-copper enzyme maturation permease subunit